VRVLISLGSLELVPRTDTPRIRSGKRAAAEHVVVGEWSLDRAAWTDRHLHEEINYVIDGELHVTYDGATYIAGPGDVVVVPAGSRARYAAPRFARMVFVYGPSSDGHAAHDTEYEELD
jgi:ethanolamine utilization protein EutQ (cupin superfamily)